MASLACLWAEPVPETERALSQACGRMNVSGCGHRKATLSTQAQGGRRNQTSEDKNTGRLVGMATLRPNPGRRKAGGEGEEGGGGCQSVSLLPTSRRGGGSAVLFQTAPGPQEGF